MRTYKNLSYITRITTHPIPPYTKNLLLFKKLTMSFLLIKNEGNMISPAPTSIKAQGLYIELPKTPGPGRNSMKRKKGIPFEHLIIHMQAMYPSSFSVDSGC